MANHKMFATAAFLIAAGLAFLPSVSSATALVLGIVLALTVGNPFAVWVKKATPWLFQVAIVGLGAGVDLATVGRAGLHGLIYTAIGISLTFLAGYVLSRALRIPRGISLLVTVGTAICGGSAIAAVASAIRARGDEISVSLAIVFLLNAMALFIFPWIGHSISLNEMQFGLWSALAIHDTSSVVGAAIQFGPDSVQLATTVKLARALWIIPVTFLIAFFWRSDEAEKAAPKIKWPWFILGFAACAGIFSLNPAIQSVGLTVAAVAKRVLVFSLFLIGSGLNRSILKVVGFRPLVQGLTLWVLVASTTLWAITRGYIR